MKHFLLEQNILLFLVCAHTHEHMCTSTCTCICPNFTVLMLESVSSSTIWFQGSHSGSQAWQHACSSTMAFHCPQILIQYGFLLYTDFSFSFITIIILITWLSPIDQMKLKDRTKFNSLGLSRKKENQNFLVGYEQEKVRILGGGRPGWRMKSL